MARLPTSSPVIFWTRHSVVATPHHRNKEAMADTIRVFADDPAKAEALVRGQEAPLIIFCRTANDFTRYRQARKDALTARTLVQRPAQDIEIRFALPAIRHINRAADMHGTQGLESTCLEFSCSCSGTTRFSGRTVTRSLPPLPSRTTISRRSNSMSLTLRRSPP